MAETYTLATIGSTYELLKDYPQALEYYEQSLAIAQNIKDRQDEVTILASIERVNQVLDN